MSGNVNDEAVGRALPEDQDLARVLRSLSASAPKHTNFDQVVGAAASQSEGGQRDYPELLLYADRSGKFSLSRVSGALSKLLAEAGHRLPQESARFLLAQYLFHRDRQLRPITTLRSMVTSLRKCELLQFFVSGMRAGMLPELKMGPFTIGPTPGAQLRHWSERAGSEDFYSLHGERLRGRACVWRESREVIILPLHQTKLGLESKPVEGSQAYSITDRYFSELGRDYLGVFWNELKEIQQVPVALGSPYLDPRLLTGFGSIGSGISIFARVAGGGGWVAPMGQIFRVNFSRTRLALAGIPPEGRRFDSVSAPFLERLRAFGRLLMRAEEHETEGRADEAFLHRVIALDAVLGSVNGTTKSIASRGALLLPKKFGTLSERRGLLEAMYDVRSRYVHEGHPCDSSYSERLQEICPLMAAAVARAGQAAQGDSLGEFKKWHQRLDALYAGIEAGVALPSSELASVGVADCYD